MKIPKNFGYYKIKNQFVDSYNNKGQRLCRSFTQEGIKEVFDRLWREDYVANKGKMLKLWKTNQLTKEFEGLTEDQLYFDLENPNWKIIDKAFSEVKDIEALKGYVKRVYPKSVTGVEDQFASSIIDSYSKKDIIFLLETDGYTVTPFVCSHWEDQEGYTESYLIGKDL